MEHNGELKISTRLLKLKDIQFVEMEFEDNGCGISKENLKRMFEPFFTTKRPDKGVGLGLSVSRSIIKQHKGDILVESPVTGKDKGTIFRVRIPASR
jgi:signal transduction histidine kinase